MIKVRSHGPKSRYWMDYARWLWEQHRGPVPCGLRVAHVDGDTLNDDLNNLELCTAADIAFLWHDRNPEASAANYQALRAATADCNRLRSRIHRETRWLNDSWYAVDHQRHLIYDRPFRERWQLYRAIGIQLRHPGQWIPAALGWPDLSAVQACALAALANAPTGLDTRALHQAITTIRSALRSGLGPVTITTIRGLVCHGLRKADYLLSSRRLNHRHLKVHWITRAALDCRGPVSPVTAIRGRNLDADTVNYKRTPWSQVALTA